MKVEDLVRIKACNSTKCSRSYYQQQFEVICSKLLSEFVLCIGESDQYRLLEVEAYLYEDEFHKDPFTHNHPKQRVPGRWFFHHVGMSAGFRGGTRKGMDITMGDCRNECKGGFLIRAIQHITSGTVIDGPCLLVDNILKTLKMNNLKDLVNTYFNESKGTAGDKSSGFWLEHRPSPVSELGKKRKVDHQTPQIYRSIRIGLGMKAKQDYLNRLDFVGRPYRFVIQPHLLQKGKLWLALELLENSALSIDEIAEVLNMKPSVIEEYQNAFLEGKTHPKSILKSCIQSKDMASGNSEWKCKALGAIRFWEQQDDDNKKISF
ncbi:hypothetical protein NQZ79_g5798 [Umbelopsis isabellina]|nr:hypothetical protein NQZ79_g5798 [Umbelopsis isabellina]